MCVISYLLTATCGPKGYGSGLPLPSRTAAEYYQTISCPRSEWSILVGRPRLLGEGECVEKVRVGVLRVRERESVEAWYDGVRNGGTVLRCCIE